MKKNSFVEGTVVTYIILLIIKILGAVYVIPFYKIIGEAGGVIYSYAYNVYNLFLNISTSGIPTAVSIIISEYNALKMFKAREDVRVIANRLIGGISFVAFLVMFISAPLIVDFFIGDIESSLVGSVILGIRVISFCLLIIPFLSVMRGYLQGNKYVTISSFSQLIEQVVRIFIVLVGSYVAINVLHQATEIGVGVALSGTVISGLVAFIYLKLKLRKSKEKIDDSQEQEVAKTSVIIKKIIMHAIPIIIISVTQNIYELVDLKLIIKGLSMVGFKGDVTQLIASIVVTWAPKICMVINALAIGLCASIIPFIVDSYVKHDNKKLNDKFNQAIKTILYVASFLAIFIMILAKPVYYIFYGNSSYGSTILIVEAIVSVFFSITMVINMILQGMKKYKIVYLNSIVGIVVNALLDIPIILLLNKYHIVPYIGSLIATIIGQCVSIAIVVIYLKREFKFKYDMIELFKKLLVPLILSMIIMIIGSVIMVNVKSYLLTLMGVGIIGVISGLIYVLLTYKNGVMSDVLGDNFIEKLQNKFRRKSNGSC